MITNFEGITSPLTEDEMKIIPYLVDGLKRRSKANPIKGEDICNRLQEFKKNIGVSEKPKLTDSRLTGYFPLELHQTDTFASPIDLK